MNPSGVTLAPRIVNRFFEFSLLGMLAAGYFAVLGSGFLDWPTAALTLLGLCARALAGAGVVKIEPPPRVVAALAILGSLLVGIIMAKLIELPLLKVRDRFFPSRSRPPTAALSLK
jgi:uncharacterized membrane protein YfcA